MNEVVKSQYGYYSVKDIPTETELSEYYAKKYYQEGNGSYETTYDAEEIQYFKNKIAERAFVVEQNLSVASSRNFLDIGCGEGWAMGYFKEKGWHVTGLDYSSFGCQQNNPGCAGNLIAGDIYKNLKTLIQNNQQYSLIWLDNVLEHVTDPVFLVNEIKKIIEPDGLLVIEVPNDFSLIQEHLYENKKVDCQYWIVMPDHLSYFNQDGLNNLMYGNGYNVIDVISDYPVDINLLNANTNYVSDKTKGKSCHRERIEFDNLLHNSCSTGDIVSFYKSAAKLGLGRAITGFFKLQ